MVTAASQWRACWRRGQHGDDDTDCTERLPTEWDDSSMSHLDVGTVRRMMMAAEADELARDLNLCDLYMYASSNLAPFLVVFAFSHALLFSHFIRMLKLLCLISFIG
jgi:hypothetical protein